MSRGNIYIKYFKYFSMIKIKVYVGAQFDWYEVFLKTRIGKYPSNTHYTLFCC